MTTTQSTTERTEGRRSRNAPSSLFAVMYKETTALLSLAGPSVVIELSTVVPGFVAASYVGRHFGPEYLDGFTLANLTMNLCNLSLMAGLYSAADTMSPQAYAAGNFRQVGLLAIMGFGLAMLLLVPINLVIVTYLDQLLINLGHQPVITSNYACQWYRVYAPVALPSCAVFQSVWKFLAAQGTLMPLVVAILLSWVVLLLTIDPWTKHFGFVGSACAILSYQVMTVVVVLLYLWIWKPHRPESWPGLKAAKEAFFGQWTTLSTYALLGAGGMLACSEWIYWEVIAVMVGTMGVVELSAHTIPYQVIWVLFMLPMGLGMALAVRLGAILAWDPRKALHLARLCLMVGLVVFGIESFLLHQYRRHIFALFTTDQDVLACIEPLWSTVCWYNLIVAMYGIISGVAIGLGMQWTFGFLVFVYMWVLGIPSVYYLSLVRGGGLSAVWSCLWPTYLAIDLTLVAIAFLFKDWTEVAEIIRLREGIKNDDDDELNALTLHVQEHSVITTKIVSNQVPLSAQVESYGST